MSCSKLKQGAHQQTKFLTFTTPSIQHTRHHRRPLTMTDVSRHGLGGHGRIDHEAAIARFRRNSIGSDMKRAHSTYTDDHQRMTPPEVRRRRRVAAVCLLAGTALVASSWTVQLPAEDDRRLAESSLSSLGRELVRNS